MKNNKTENVHSFALRERGYDHHDHADYHEDHADHHEDHADHHEAHADHHEDHADHHEDHDDHHDHHDYDNHEICYANLKMERGYSKYLGVDILEMVHVCMYITTMIYCHSKNTGWIIYLEFYTLFS